MSLSSLSPLSLLSLTSHSASLYVSLPLCMSLCLTVCLSLSASLSLLSAFLSPCHSVTLYHCLFALWSKKGNLIILNFRPRATVGAHNKSTIWDYWGIAYTK